jgi:hypothetical protein
MVAPSPLSEAERAEVNQPAAAESAALLYRATRAAAEAMVPTIAPPLTLEQIDRRRSGRLGQARGMVQAFAAEEVSIAELLAYIATVEQPARVQDVRLVLSDLAAERRRARHILRQINAAERAMVQLWLIRMQQGLEAGEGAS